LNDARIVMTDSAREVVERVRAERGESLSLVIGNGCCDSTAPFLFAGYVAGPNEQRIGSVADVEVFLDRALEDTFAGTEVVVDVADDPSPDSFSCESELGCRFFLSRLPSS
jgi:uncharacterized protein (DUF779 family)